jgi:S-adenosylmethionine synthetase
MEPRVSNSFPITSDSVTEGHPDKIADQISAAVLDAIIAEDPDARVACETLVTTGLACVAGEISTRTYVSIPEIVRGTIKSIGYDNAAYGFDSQTCAVISTIDQQSPDIAMGVDTGGAGDQGMMFGYATDETPELMPMPIQLAHGLTRLLAERRKSGALPWLRPDGKSQVTVRYEDGRPTCVDTVVISTQHDAEIAIRDLREAITEEIIVPGMPEGMFDRRTATLCINPTGRFVVGGPMGDTGLTGRKIIVDTYGGATRHGGGAFSGKDPSKVDRSAAYAARWVAKNIVAAGLARRCEVQLAYAIGVREPVCIGLDTFGTAVVDEICIEKAVREVFDLTPAGIRSALDLCTPIYRATAAYGHFGRASETRRVDGRSFTFFTWERTDKVDALRSAVR